MTHMHNQMRPHQAEKQQKANSNPKIEQSILGKRSSNMMNFMDHFENLANNSVHEIIISKTSTTQKLFEGIPDAWHR